MQNIISKQILRIITIIVIALISLLLLLYIFVRTPIGENIIKDFISESLSETLQTNVSIKTLKTDIFSFVKLNDISIYADDTENSSKFEINSLEIHYSLLTILKNKINISSVVLDGLNAKILRDDKGNFLLPLPKQTGEPIKDPLQVSFKSINVINASIIYEDRAIPLDGNIQDLEVVIKHSIVDTSYNFSANLSYAGFDYKSQQYTIEQFLIIGSTQGQKIEVDTLSLKAEGVHLCGNANIVLKENPNIAGKIRISGNPEQLIAKLDTSIPPQFKPLQTDFVALITFDGSVSEPNLHARLTYPTLTIGELAFQNGNVEVSFARDSLNIQKIYAEIFEGSFSAQGWMMLDSTESYNIDLDFSNLDFAQLWEYYYNTNSPYKGSLTGTVSSSGAITSILSSQLSGKVQLHKMTFKEKSIDPINCTFSYNAGDTALRMVQDSSFVESKFILRDSKIDGSAAIHIKNIEYVAGLFNLLEARGKLYADADFTGELSNPEIHAKIKGVGLSYKQFPVDSLYAEIQYTDSSLYVKSSSFSGKMDSIPTLVATLTNEEILGRAQYNGSISGTLKDFSGNLSLHADSVKYKDFAVPSLVLECTAKNSDISVNTLNIDMEKVRCEAKGDFSLSERSGNLFVDFKDKEKNTKHHFGSIQSSFSVAENISLNANLKELSLEMLGAFSDSLVGIQGSVSGNVSFEGTIDKPTGSVSLNIDKPAYKDLCIDNISLQGELTPSEIILSNGTVQLFNNEIRIRGKLELDESKGGIAVSPHSTLRGEISLSEVKLADFTQEFLDAIQVQGTLTSTVQIGGTLAAPDVSGSLRVNSGFVRLDKHKSPVENLDALLIFSDSTLNINKCTGLYEGKTFSLTGSISESGWSSFSPNIALSINGMQAVCLKGTFQQDDIDLHLSLDEFDISFLETLTPAIMNAHGNVNASVDIRGTMQTPLFRGYVKAENIDVLPTDFPVPFSRCMLDISATDEQMVLKNFRCMFNEGFVNSSGYVKYGNGVIKDIAFHLEAENIALKKPKMYQFTLKSCSLNYKQQKTGYLIEGSVVLGKTKYLQDMHISKLLDSLGKPKIFQKPSQLMMQTKLNVRITESKDIWIDNNLARICLKADVGVIGTLAQPNLTGRIETTEGYIVYLDRKFEITRGIFDFTDPNVINPILDIQAETDIKNYEQPDAEPYHIIFAVTGQADKATVTLQSIPSLDEANILSLITIGTTREQIFSQTPDKYSTSLKDILLERAEQYSSQKISGFVAGQMAHIFDLDDVTIEGNLFNFGDSWGPQLVASKQLSKRMKVTYSTRIGYLNEQSIELDYKLTDHFYLQGQADQEGNAGVDVIYRVNFK
ncbi:MAG: translocation/assembly module TamB domain-containing protein [Candidatus Cloacimonetes bacterium]|nr:translocation/assembly module TamB domain-containing protein [Candidatus Cloacimonadota bacterium]